MTKALAVALVLFCAACIARAATVEQPRALGHRLGDVLAQRVLLQIDGRDATPSALPPADRVGAWFERRTPRVEGPDADGRRWLRIEYQVINSPREPIGTALPALSIATDLGALAVPEHAVGLAPIAPATATALRPDRAVAPMPLAPIERALRQTAAALGAVLLAWLAWWRWREARDARRLPFARAWRELRRDGHGDGAWRALHRALDASAGHVVRAETLPRLFGVQPHLRALEPELQAFYRGSDARFFGGDAAAGDAPDLRALARRLRDAERRDAR